MSATLLNEFRDSREETPNPEAGSALLSRLSERRWLLAGSTILLGTLGLALCAIAKPKFEARSILLLPLDLPAMPAGSAASLLGAGGPNALDVLRGIATSHTTQTRIQKKFGIHEREFKDLLKVSGDLDSNELTLTIIDDRRELSLGILQETIDALSDLNREIGFSSASRQADYLVDTMRRKESELSVARLRLAAFQKSMKAPSDPSDPASVLSSARQLRQAQMDLAMVDHEVTMMKRQASQQAAAALSIGSALPASDKWRPRVVEAEYQFKLVERQYGPKNPEYITAKGQLDVTRAAAEKEIAGNLAAINTGVDATVAGTLVKREALRWTVGALQQIADKAPEESLTVTKLLTDVRQKEAVLGDLQRRYESAKVDAQVDKVRWTLLEKPHLSEEPVNKAFVRQAALFGILGFLGALVIPLRRRR